jgi:hypothetical protein
MIVDAVLTYQFVKRFAMPFSMWRACKLGIIDSKGNILKKRRDLVTDEERAAFGTFDLLVLNLKKLLARVPGGSTFAGAAAASAFLMREDSVEEFARLIEDAPTNSVGSGQVAGAGVGLDGEPGKRSKSFNKMKKILKRSTDAIPKLPDEPLV